MKAKKQRKGHAAQKIYQALNGQELNIPYAYCDLCEGDKQRAMCECLNCNMPLCLKCKEKHLSNPRL